MVRDVAPGNALRASARAKPAATEARSVAALRMAGGMEPASAGGLDGAGQRPDWQTNWHPRIRRFIALQYCDGNECEEGDQWRIIDTEELAVIGWAETKLKAELLANALEYTSLNVRVEEFETAVTAALNEAKSQDEKRETAINAARETQ